MRPFIYTHRWTHKYAFNYQPQREHFPSFFAIFISSFRIGLMKIPLFLINSSNSLAQWEVLPLPHLFPFKSRCVIHRVTHTLVTNIPAHLFPPPKRANNNPDVPISGVESSPKMRGPVKKGRGRLSINGDCDFEVDVILGLMDVFCLFWNHSNDHIILIKFLKFWTNDISQIEQKLHF